MLQGSKNIGFMFRFFFLCVSIFILFLIVDFNLVITYIKSIPLSILIVLIIIGVFRTWLTGLRWQLLNPDVSGQLTPWQYFRFLMMANAVNLLLPGALAGDVVRASVIFKTVRDKRVDNVIAIIVDRFIGLLSIVLLGTVAFIFTKDIQDPSAFHVFFAVIYLVIGVIVFIFTSNYALSLIQTILSRLGRTGYLLYDLISTWRNALKYFWNNKNNVLIGLLICLPIHLTSFITTYILAQSLDINLSFIDVSLITALVFLVTAIPISIAGLGVRELSMIYFFSIYGIDAEPAAALSIYVYILNLLIGLLGFLFFIDKRKKPVMTAEGKSKA